MTHRRLLDELINGTTDKEADAVLKTRGDNVISSACSLLDDIEEAFGEEQAMLMERRLLASIKQRNYRKFKLPKRNG